MKRNSGKLIWIFSLIILIAIGCRKQDQSFPPIGKHNADDDKYDSYVAQSWYNFALRLIEHTPGHTPPISARDFGYMGVTVYESLVGGMQHGHTLAGQLQGLSRLTGRNYGDSYDAAIIANAALAKITRSLFSNASAVDMSKMDSIESANEKLFGMKIGQETFQRSRDFGRSVADAVFEWSKTDGGDQAFLDVFPSNYILPKGPDKWIPTPPPFQPAMLPYWGSNRVMVAANNEGPVDPPAPPEFSSDSGTFFSNAAYEVYNISLSLTDEQKTIASYWADANNTFTPPGHSMAITLQIIRNYNLNLNEAAVLLAKVGIAVSDGGIVCWRAKYKYNLLRPVSYIQLYINLSNWATYIGTPPFPTYTSGHTTFSGAAAGILTAEMGSHTSFSDSSKMSYGFVPRSFSSFNAYALEAADSRFFGGIHYKFDNAEGYTCGQHIAANVEALNW
jgi:PAP2 superfamily